MITEQMKGQLMAIGLSKQQVSSATADAIVNYLMNEDEKALIQEARNRVAEMYSIVTSLREEYSMLKQKIETVAGTLLDITKAEAEHGIITDEKAKNAVAMYGAIIKMNERAGAKGADSVNNAGYVTYAYLGGQAKRDIRYDQSRDGENSRYADI